LGLLTCKNRLPYDLYCVGGGDVKHYQGRGFRGGSPTAVQALRTCPLWEPFPSHPYYCRLGDLLCLFCVYIIVYVYVYLVVFVFSAK